MFDFASEVASLTVPQGSVGVFWLGQAGFLFKTDKGELLAVDPYLSDCCNRYFGFKRLMPKVLGPYDLTLDWLLCTHAHYDHFDVDTVPMLLDNGKTRLAAAKDVRTECERLNIPEDRVTYLSVGDCLEAGSAVVKAVPCDHGELAPDALGLLLQFGGKRVYLMGDTCLREDYLQSPELQGVDLLIAPINGAFGNLDEAGAARVAKLLQPKLTIPCHFWNFAEHEGDPQKFAKEMGEAPYALMRLWEGILL